MSELSMHELERLLEIWEAAVRTTHDFLAEEDILFLRPLVRDQYLSSVQIIVARDDKGQIQGFMGLSGFEQEKSEAHEEGVYGSSGMIEMLFVHPDCHGMGIGRSLVRIAESGFQDLFVDVNEQNPGALAFYKRCGFVVVGRSPLDGQGKPFPLLHMRLA